MHIGETSLRVTSLLAAGLRRPKLRTDLRVSRQVVLGEVTYVIKVLDTDTYYRFEGFEWETLCLFDGTRTYRAAWDELRRRDPGTEITLAELEDFVSTAGARLWEKSITEKNLALLEKIRSERKERGERSSIFYLSFSAFNPDPFFRWIHPYIRWLWTREFVIVSLALFIFAIWVFVAEWDRLLGDTAALWSFQGKSLTDLAQLWTVILIYGFIHECGHGLTCKHYGGEVKQMGFMLMYFLPAFYTNVTDMYLFDKDYKRLWTIFAGVWVTALTAAVALIVWMLAIPGTALSDWAYKLMLVNAVNGIFINFNPLMKFDGYYTLCQLLKIDNLREESFVYLKSLIKRYVFGVKNVELESIGRRRRRIFLLFGPPAFLYTTTMVIVIVLFVNNVLTTKFGLWGWALTAVFAGLILRRPVRGLVAFVRERITLLRGSQ